MRSAADALRTPRGQAIHALPYHDTQNALPPEQASAKLRPPVVVRSVAPYRRT